MKAFAVPLAFEDVELKGSRGGAPSHSADSIPHGPVCPASRTADKVFRVIGRIAEVFSNVFAAGNVGHLAQSSSASRLTAGASGFLNFNQSGDLPER